MTTISKPQVHLNGTSGRTLMNDYREVAETLHKAIDALAATTPHMRDYYVQVDGDAKFHLAREEHQRRLQKLQDVIDDMAALYEHVITVEEERAKLRGR